MKKRDLEKDLESIIRVAKSDGKNSHNLSIIEHPHDGLIMIFVDLDDNGNENIYLSYLKNDSKEWESTNKIQIEIENIKNFHDISQVTFLDLHGYLQLVFCIERKIYKMSSTNYGKTWNEPSRIELFTENLRFKNQPIFTQYGKILLPVFDEDAKRCFTLTSEDFGKSWFPSTYIEISEEIIEQINQNSGDQSNYDIENPENIIKFHGFAPTLIHQAEIKVTAFLQASNLSYILMSDSTDAGETWNEAEFTPLLSSNTSIDAIRLRDEEGNYLPTILLVYVDEETEKGTNSTAEILKIAVSQDNCETWDYEIFVDSGEKGTFADPSIIQCSNGIIHIAYGFECTVIKHKEFDSKLI